MIPVKWPPELDAIKVDRHSILARVKNTDVWINLDSSDDESLLRALPADLKSIFIAWRAANFTE